ncbi:MAG: hypothetical protein EAZ84_10230 [Verrucomicrobia bacterium]|nr:MAG: hypothetical protein EAZ84_10230 [Verrucomicrobiota bacterium]TAE86368.1 MAG: hypothetical protein EAZ82_11395 [Verrucomicrobiota bacterium]TAF24347.1 MAG: hypothetical protein EAZ71_10750 [Verrucomicrobiota bacterium]
MAAQQNRHLSGKTRGIVTEYTKPTPPARLFQQGNDQSPGQGAKCEPRGTVELLETMLRQFEQLIQGEAPSPTEDPFINSTVRSAGTPTRGLKQALDQPRPDQQRIIESTRLQTPQRTLVKQYRQRRPLQCQFINPTAQVNSQSQQKRVFREPQIEADRLGHGFVRFFTQQYDIDRHDKIIRPRRHLGEATFLSNPPLLGSIAITQQIFKVIADLLQKQGDRSPPLAVAASHPKHLGTANRAF